MIESTWGLGDRLSIIILFLMTWSLILWRTRKNKVQKTLEKMIDEEAVE